MTILLLLLACGSTPEPSATSGPDGICHVSAGKPRTEDIDCPCQDEIYVIGGWGAVVATCHPHASGSLERTADGEADLLICTCPKETP
jgi:hypothetical protein